MYQSAANEYKKAFELDGKDAEAYIKYIDTFIDSSKAVNEKGNTELKLEDGLNTVANRVKNKYEGIDENDEVLYKLGLTYFTEVNDYGAAAKYFKMVDKTDEDYGELADYYGSIALILSSTNVNANELIDKVNGFASYNINSFTNDNPQKFENYKTVGKIYVSYLNNEGVPGQAEAVMTQAVKDLADYTGEDAADYFFEYNSDLAEIYFTLGEKAENGTENYKLALNYYQEVVSQIKGKVKLDETTDNETAKGLVQSYVNNQCRIADIYAKLGDSEAALKTYQDTEAEMGSGNVLAVKVYSEHLNYLYTTYESKQQDPGKWTDKQKEDILAIYHEGNKIEGIASNPTWIKRSSTMDGLDDGSLTEEKEETSEESSEETTEEAADQGEEE